MEKNERERIAKLAQILSHQLVMQDLAESWMECSTHHEVEVVEIYGRVMWILPIYNER